MTSRINSLYCPSPCRRLKSSLQKRQGLRVVLSSCVAALLCVSAVPVFASKVSTTIADVGGSENHADAAAAMQRAELNPRANFFEDTDTLIDVLGTTLGCRLSERLQAGNMPVAPLYTDAGGSCEAVAGTAASDGSYFADADCRTSLEFRRSEQQAYCALALDETNLGNGAGLPDAGYWTLTPGSRYDLGTLSINGKQQPYLHRTVYRRIETEAGLCELEMRVYKNNPGAEGLAPMLALHGGSWRARGFGFFGLEMSAAHYTDAGFVVFAPFYRLLDSKEGPAACHNATMADIVSDAEAALDWIVAQGSRFGVHDYPTVFGQSAGAHLATAVAVRQPERIANAVLFYPPTDFSDFAARIIDGSYTDPEGLSIFESVTRSSSVDAEMIDLSASPIPENTFPAMVATDPSRYPPMFILHGLADNLVEATQSSRLCGAMRGDVEALPDRAGWLQRPGLRQVEICNPEDTRSELHLFREADHALDVCITSNLLLDDLCLAGSAGSQALVADSMREVINWSAAAAAERLAERDSEGNAPDGETDSGSNPDEGTTTVSTGGGASYWLLYLVLAGCTYRRLIATTRKVS